MLPLVDASAASLHSFVTDFVEPGLTVITEGWQVIAGWISSATATTGAVSGPPGPAGRTPASSLPGGGAPGRFAGHAVAVWCPQGSVDATHLASYLNEFLFRFNRRRSGSRGMVFYG